MNNPMVLCWALIVNTCGACLFIWLGYEWVAQGIGLHPAIAGVFASTMFIGNYLLIRNLAKEYKCHTRDAIEHMMADGQVGIKVFSKSDMLKELCEEEDAKIEESIRKDYTADDAWLIPLDFYDEMPPQIPLSDQCPECGR